MMQSRVVWFYVTCASLGGHKHSRNISFCQLLLLVHFNPNHLTQFLHQLWVIINYSCPEGYATRSKCWIMLLRLKIRWTCWYGIVLFVSIGVSQPH